MGARRVGWIDGSRKKVDLGSWFPTLFAGKSEKDGARRVVRTDGSLKEVELGFCGSHPLLRKGWGTEVCAGFGVAGLGWWFSTRYRVGRGCLSGRRV